MAGLALRTEINLESVYRNLLVDIGSPIDERIYFMRRLRNEGLPFVTKTLPLLAKAVLRGLETGHFCSRSELSSFQWKSGLPRLFRGFLLGIFDEKGVVRSDPDTTSLWVIRQICEYTYKLALPFKECEVVAAEESFLKTDDEVVGLSPENRTFVEEVRRNVERHYRFPKLHEVLSEHRPRNGPGTFASEADTGREPSVFKASSYGGTTIPKRFLGIAGYFKSYPASAGKRYADLSGDGVRTCTSGEALSLGPDTSSTSEVLFVPKDSRGPRTIVREPLKALALQMSYFDWFSGFTEKVTHHRVNFKDQACNRLLAKEGSLTGRWATLDLKEASDRVSTSVVTTIFRNVPVMRYFLNQRTPCTKLPSGKVIPLKKLAGMGSGLTFGTMAFLIHISIATKIAAVSGLPYPEASSLVYVYGDDIIVPTQHVPAAKQALQLVGLKTNESKSFTSRSSRFRESCGGDYFYGEEVAPVRLKLSNGVTQSTRSRTSVVLDEGAILQLERHCRELIKDGWVSLAEYYYVLLERCLGPLPTVSFTSSVLGRLGDPQPRTDRFGNHVRVKAYVPIPTAKPVYDANPYFFVGKQVVPSSDDGFTPFVDYTAGPTGFVVTTRKVRIRKRSINSFATC